MDKDTMAFDPGVQMDELAQEFAKLNPFPNTNKAPSVYAGKIYDGCTPSSHLPPHHALSLPKEVVTPSKLKQSATGEQKRVNELRSSPRQSYNNVPPKAFLDGPGTQSKLGSRHDNDSHNIEEIKLFPTTDEVLANRPPFLPRKDSAFRKAGEDFKQGFRELAAVLFRHLRFEVLESIIDTTYAACQSLVDFSGNLTGGTRPKHGNETNSTQHSLFTAAKIERIMFLDRAGAAVEISFPLRPLSRGNSLSEGGLLEPGMLISLISFDKISRSFRITYLQIEEQLQIPRMGEALRMRIIASFADPGDVEKVKELLYSFRTQSSDVLYAVVDYGPVLVAGFAHHLRRLKQISSSEESELSEASILVELPMIRQSVPAKANPPAYSQIPGFYWNLNCLKSNADIDTTPFVLNTQNKASAVAEIVRRTTLDKGQAEALYNNLTSSVSFTQGPPGTGKSFLAVSTIKVLLESLEQSQRGPVMVVTQTNHTLDDMLETLVAHGIKETCRVGNKSTSAILIRNHLLRDLSRKYPTSKADKNMKSTAGHELQAGLQEGENLTMAWSLDNNGSGRLIDLNRSHKHDPSEHDNWIHAWRRLAGKSSIGIRSERSPPGKSDTSSQDVPKPGGSAYRNRKEQKRGEFLNLSVKEQCDAVLSVHLRCQAADKAFQRVQNTIHAKKLRNVKILGLTSTAVASMHALLLKVQPRILIIEEASELTEAHTLCALLPSVEHIIAIGDPKQLRPQVSQQPLQTMRNGYFRFDESLFERWVKSSQPFSQLNVQRRAHPDLACLMQATDYPFVISHPTTQKRSEVRGMANRMQWMTHFYAEDGGRPGDGCANTSFSNTYEADYVVQMALWLVSEHNYQIGDITVLTPYNGQLDLLKSRMQEHCVEVILREHDIEKILSSGFFGKEDLGDIEDELERMIERRMPLALPLDIIVRAATIDNYQGEEAAIIIFSAVRSNKNQSIGFLGVENRINVAISRARNGFYAIGNSKLLERNSKFWQRVLAQFWSRNLVDLGMRVRCTWHPKCYNVIRDAANGAFYPRKTGSCKECTKERERRQVQV